jgi:uncharacterized protein YndB with AHSA1/START domain
MTTLTSSAPTTSRPAHTGDIRDIRIIRDYPHPPAKVWRALTDPALIALWGMRPEGFAPVVGNRFRLVARPNPGWRGYVECEVLEVREPTVLCYSWVGDDSGKATRVSYTLEPHAGGTRLTFEHTGFTGVGGFLLAKLMMGPGWRKMLGKAFPAVLADIDAAGRLRDGSALKPRF